MIATHDWAEEDDGYRYDALFDSVVDLFENDPTDPWVVETLEWYQRYD